MYLTCDYHRQNLIEMHFRQILAEPDVPFGVQREENVLN